MYGTGDPYDSVIPFFMAGVFMGVAGVAAALGHSWWEVVLVLIGAAVCAYHAIRILINK